MMRRRFAAIAGAALVCAGSALAQEKLPPLRTGVDGTFAPHAMPKLGGGIEGFQIDLFTEAARRMKREITIDAVSFSTLIPGMQAGRYDFIAAPTPVTKNNPQLRAQLQDALDCMKKDGTIARLSEKWFARKPAPDDLENVITPGYGVPGMPGYDPTPHELHCS